MLDQYTLSLLSHPDRSIRLATEKMVDIAVLNQIIKIEFFNSNSAFLLLAAASGCTLGVLDYDAMSKAVFERARNGFDKEAFKLALEGFERGVDKTLQLGLWKKLYYEFRGRAAVASEQELIASFIGRLGVKSLGDRAKELGVAFGESALEYAIKLRRDDLDNIYKILDHEMTQVRPHFLRAKSLGKSKYGKPDEKPLILEARDCFNGLLRESMKFYIDAIPLYEIISFVMERSTASQEFSDNPPDNGIDFEHWCAAQLEKQGWRTKVSSASGDQGVDVEAWKGNFFVVVQCKRYSKPIGNSAVQEVFAGRQHRFADAAAIIGTGAFTRSAKELAKATNVEMFDVSEIAYFSDRFHAINNEG